MVMTVMDVRIMGMGMEQQRMNMRVRMRLLAIPFGIMLVLMMAVVAVLMHVGQRRVLMAMIVLFSQVKPDAAAHQRRGNPEQRAGRLAQHHQ